MTNDLFMLFKPCKIINRKLKLDQSDNVYCDKYNEFMYPLMSAAIQMSEHVQNDSGAYEFFFYILNLF